jgi:hypothetical protein
MKKIIATILLLLWQTLIVFSQQSSPLLVKDKPTVYLSFERVGERKPIHPSESNQGIWLRLHNNTKWAINFCTLSLYIPPKAAPFRLTDGRGVLALREGVEVNMCHGVEEVSYYESVITSDCKARTESLAADSSPQVGYDKGDVFSSAWLPPGQSVTFSVPREHLGKDLAIFIRFNYEWEYGERTFRSDEPEHRVYFRAVDLPEGIVKVESKAKRQ